MNGIIYLFKPTNELTPFWKSSEMVEKFLASVDTEASLVLTILVTGRYSGESR
jgi:hypothetical protein